MAHGLTATPVVMDSRYIAPTAKEGEPRDMPQAAPKPSPKPNTILQFPRDGRSPPHGGRLDVGLEKTANAYREQWMTLPRDYFSPYTCRR